MKRKNLNFLTTLLVLATQFPAGAVIVAGTSGTGNNNDTQAGLASYLSSASLTTFPYWDNLVRVSNSSGVYLGYNASTLRGWVLSADHINPEPTTITVAGKTYTVSGTSAAIGSSDLTLYEIGGGALDPALPFLPTVPLASATASFNQIALMFGRGFTNDTTGPYSWVIPGTDDANAMRWASNSIQGNVIVGSQPYVVVDFDGPTDPGVTPFDGQAANGDSGGGLFTLRAGVWELSGIAHFVDDGPNFLEVSPTGDGIVDPSQPGDFSAYSSVFAKSVAITGITGTLVPEPSALLLSLAAIPLLFRRRR